MGSCFSLTCDSCGYSVETTGPWEFYRDARNRRRDFGHPSPVSDEAARRGVAGLYGNLYCRSCDKVVKVVLVEFKEPGRSALQVWSGMCEPEEKYLRDDAVRCPKCRNQFLILEPDDAFAPSCPRCAKGIMNGRFEWIS